MEKNEQLQFSSKGKPNNGHSGRCLKFDPKIPIIRETHHWKDLLGRILEASRRRRKWEVPEEEKFFKLIYLLNYSLDCRTAMTWAPEGCRRRGRPWTTWRRTAEKKRERTGWRSWSEVSTAAAWREEVRWNYSLNNNQTKMACKPSDLVYFSDNHVSADQMTSHI